MEHEVCMIQIGTIGRWRFVGMRCLTSNRMDGEKYKMP